MAREKPRERRISVELYPGLTTLELIGTVSVLDGLETRLAPVIVGENHGPVSPNTPLKLVPQVTFEDVSRPFGLLVPGSGPNAIAAMGDEATAREVQRVIDYDPQPPFGGLHYGEMGLPLRARRTAATLAAPLLTARPKRLTRRDRATGRTGGR